MSESYYTKTDNGEFLCKYCDKKTTKQNTMYYHVQTKHVQDFKFVCEHCSDKKFVQKSAYLQHMAQAHADLVAETTEENPYVGVSYSCAHPECSHTAKTKANVLVHFARTHCKEWIPTYSKEVGCNCCDKKFSSSTAYFYHTVTSMKAPQDFAKMIADMK